MVIANITRDLHHLNLHIKEQKRDLLLRELTQEIDSLDINQTKGHPDNLVGSQLTEVTDLMKTLGTNLVDREPLHIAPGHKIRTPTQPHLLHTVLVQEVNKEARADLLEGEVQDETVAVTPLTDHLLQAVPIEGSRDHPLLHDRNINNDPLDKNHEGAGHHRLVRGVMPTPTISTR